MKTRKLLALLLSACMVLGILAGCGSSSSDTTAASGSTAAAEEEDEEEDDDDLFVPTVVAETPAAEDSAEEGEEAEDAEPAGPSYTLPISEEGLTYSIWMTYAPFAADLVNTETMEGMLVLDTLQEVTNIHFDVSAANGAAEQDNFNLMIASGDYCDILSSMNFYATGLEGAVEEGIVQDLADVLPEKCPTYWSYLTSNIPALMEAYTNAGYMPEICVLTPEVGQEVIGPVYRQDWAEEFGITDMKTLDDLYDYLEKAYTEKGAIYEIASTEGVVGELAYGMNLQLGDYEVVDGVVEYAEAQDSFKDYLLFMNRLYTNGIISQDFMSSTSEDLSSSARMDFGLGTNSLVAVSAANSSDIVMNVTDENFNMAVMPPVSADGTTEAHVGPTTLETTMKDNDPWCFSADCEDIDPLLQMVEYLFSDEGYILTNYGVEGETFEYDENGDPQYTDLVINNPDGLSYFFASYVYVTNAASGFFPYINDMTKTFYDFNDNQWALYEELKGMSDCTYNYPSYAVLSTDETTEYNAIESDLSTYAEEAILQFITGATDIEEGFDAFVEKLYDMGLQDMIDIKQAAYDRAMARLDGINAQLA